MQKAKASNRRWPAIAVVVTLTAAYIRFLFVDQSLWADEVQSVELAAMPLNEILARTGLLDVHPPGYYVLLKCWTAVGGGSDIWARCFSLVVGSLTVGCFALWARMHMRGLSLLFAVLTLTLSTWHVHYSLEVRSYAFLALCVVLLCWRVERWVEELSASRTPELVGLTFLTLLTGLTHYYGLFCIVGINAYVLTHSRVQGPHRKNWVVTQAMALAGLAWWLPYVCVQLFDLPEGFTSHLQNAPSFLELSSAFGPAAALPTEWAAVVGCSFLALALWGIRATLFNGGSNAHAQSDDATTSSKAQISTRWVALIATAGVLLTLISPTLVPEDGLYTGHPLLDTYVNLGFDIVSRRVILALLLVGLGWVMLYMAVRFASKLTCHCHRSCAPIVIGTVLLVGGCLHALEPSLSTRNLLALLPLTVLLAGCALTSLPKPAAVAITIVTLVLSVFSLHRSPEEFNPRPDFRSPASRIIAEQASSKPQVFVVSGFDNGALRRYLAPIPSRGVMSPSELLGLAPNRLFILLTREAWQDSERFRAAFVRRLSDRFTLTEEHTFRRAELLVFTPLEWRERGI